MNTINCNENIVVHSGRNIKDINKRDDVIIHMLSYIKNSIDEVYYYNDKTNLFYYINVGTDFEYVVKDCKSNVYDDIEHMLENNNDIYNNKLIVIECDDVNNVKNILRMNNLLLNCPKNNITLIIITKDSAVDMIHSKIKYFIDKFITVNDIDRFIDDSYRLNEKILVTDKNEYVHYKIYY